VAVTLCNCRHEDPGLNFCLLISSREQPIMCGPPAQGLGNGPATPHRKSELGTKCYRGPRNWQALVNKVINFRVPLRAG
jgi:hypothetical protein